MPGPRVVAIGDSVTLGVGDGVQDPTGEVGWAAHVAHGLDASEFTNLAANGTRARNLIPDQVERALGLNPVVILLTIGGNDVLRGDFDEAEIEDCVREAVHRLRTSGAEIMLVSLAHITLFDLFHPSITRVMTGRIDRTNTAILRAIEGMDVTVIDGMRAMTQMGRVAWHMDRIHPSPIGHRGLAERALVEIPYRKVNSIPPPAEPASFVQISWWFLKNGVPWIAKRSRDLIPQTLIVVMRELRSERKREAHRVRAMLDERGRLRTTTPSSNKPVKNRHATN